MELSWLRRDLTLRYPWTLTRGSSTTKSYHYLRVDHHGIRGQGEAAHVAYQGESLFEKARAAFGKLAPAEITQADIHALAPGDHAAKAAVDMAMLDWCSRSEEKTLSQYLSIPPGKTPPTSFSIAISDDRQVLREKIAEAEPYGILKIKLGSDNDRDLVRAVRTFTDKPLRVDANEGWATKENALEMTEWLANQGVDLIEQPMPKGHLQDVAWLCERSPLPVIADEEVKTSADIPPIISSGAYDGINVKLMKSGGVREALAMITRAREAGLQVMIGCMIESSLAIGAAKHLAPLADYVDLDGNLLITDDPYRASPGEAGIGIVLQS